MGYVIGGAKFAQFFTAANGATPAIGTISIFDYDKQVSTDVTKDESGNHSITIDGIQDSEALTTYLDTYFSTYGSGTGEDITFENADTLSATGGNPLQFGIIYGGIDSDSSSSSFNKRKIFMSLVRGTLDSGAYKQEGNKYSRPTLKYNSVDLEGALTVATTYFLTTLVTTPTQVVIGTATKKGKVAWMA